MSAAAAPGELATRARRKLAMLFAGSATVRMTGWDTVTVAAGPRGTPSTYALDGPGPTGLEVRRLSLVVPDPAALGRLIVSGLLQGRTQALSVQIAEVPRESRGGVRLAPTAWTSTEVRWRVTGRGVAVDLRWGRPQPLERALTDLASALGRDRRWPEAGSTTYVSDPAAYRAGHATFPHGVLRPPGLPTAGEGLGPVTALPDLGITAEVALDGTVANPHGRVLLGPPARYRLQRDGERLLLREGGRDVLVFDGTRSPEGVTTGAWQKFCTVHVPEDLPRTPYARLVLRALTASGALLVVVPPTVRDELTSLGFACTATDPATDLDETGLLEVYVRSVASARASLVQADSLLRQTALNGSRLLSLPTVSVTLSSKRAEDLDACLKQLAVQDYPAFEVVLATHGFDPDEATRQRWRALVPGLRVVSEPAERSFGDVLGDLARRADGDLVTKVDDDDLYGPTHLTDLVVALRSSGADLVSKSSRFTYLAEEDITLDRGKLASERFDATPAGGTFLLSRGTLGSVGGWSRSVRHVDTDLVARLSAAGAVRYRTAAQGYVYVRRGTSGSNTSTHTSTHTWAADIEELKAQASCRYAGVPSALLRSPALSSAVAS